MRLTRTELPLTLPSQNTKKTFKERAWDQMGLTRTELPLTLKNTKKYKIQKYKIQDTKIQNTKIQNRTYKNGASSHPPHPLNLVLRHLAPLLSLLQLLIIKCKMSILYQFINPHIA